MAGRWGQAYNEEAFRYFLAIERKRAEWLGHPVLLLLVDFEALGGVSARVDARVARRLFSGLCRCLRDTDVVGWYRAELVAGAVLTESRNEPGTDVPRLIGERVRGALAARVPLPVASRLRVRVHQDPPSGNFDSGRLDTRADNSGRV
jgi:hypothetical protein